MAVATLSPARTLRRPRRADPRALIGVCLTLAALAGSVAFWVGSSDARPVLVAVRELPAGATLRASDVSIAYLRLDEPIYAAALPADLLESVVGRQLAEPIHAQQVLSRAQVNSRLGLAADQVAITIAARPDTAVDGRLRVGDNVQVLVTTLDKTRNDARTRTVLERAAVFEVGRDATSGSSSLSVPAGLNDADAPPRGAIASLTLAVTAEQARQLAEARRSGELDVVLLPPAPVAHP